MLAGESDGSAWGIALSALFQSTPAIAGGRIHSSRCTPAAAKSFNPRPPLLAGESVMFVQVDAFLILFQSTPAIAGGRIPLQRLADNRLRVVSIHARHCWRANPRYSVRYCKKPACFNPRPPLLAGESSQGTSPVQGNPGFNPRPPLLAGESRQLCPGGHAGAVSIHARHCWRANPSLKVECD